MSELGFTSRLTGHKNKHTGRSTGSLFFSDEGQVFTIDEHRNVLLHGSHKIWRGKEGWKLQDEAMVFTPPPILGTLDALAV